MHLDVPNKDKVLLASVYRCHHLHYYLSGTFGNNEVTVIECDREKNSLVDVSIVMDFD